MLDGSAAPAGGADSTFLGTSLPVNPWLLAGLGIALLLVLARVSRTRPRLRTLLSPAAATLVGVLCLDVAVNAFGPSRWWPLLVIVPAWVLMVRLAIVLLHGIVTVRSGAPPPALLETLVAVFLYAGGAAYVAKSLGADLGSVLATSAFVGAIVGLALQESLGNLFTGIALHAEAPFGVGDWVRVGDHEGRVEQMSWRAVRLRTWAGDTLQIPNGNVARAALVNFSFPKAPHSRVVVVSASYDSSPNKTIEVILKALEGLEALALDPPPSVRLIAHSESALTYEIRYWFHSYEEYRQLESDILRSVWYRFRRNHIDVPYPVRDVRLRRQPPEARAEPPQQRLLQALGRVDVFRAVGEAGRAVAARAFRSECYAAGEVVIREGSPGESFFIVDHGEAAVFKGVSGAEVARLREGDYFGEMSLLTGEARAATIRAVTDVDVFTIDKAGFREILAASPGVEAEVSRTLAERQRALDAAARDYTAQGEPSRSTQELNQRILLRIRAYFGL